MKSMNIVGPGTVILMEEGALNSISNIMSKRYATSI